MRPGVLILTGYGVNCEAESAAAWERAGARADLVHLNDLLASPARLHEYGALMFIGGFSFGDHMGSGLAFSLRVRHRLRADLERFLDAGKLVLGVCNGFQVMVKLGLLPALDGPRFEQSVSLIRNDCGHFQNFWVRVGFDPDSPCVFTRGLGAMDLPIRHGEGRLFTPDRAHMRELADRHLIACTYRNPDGSAASSFPHNPNGSLFSAAGLCDPSGRAFGLMPHPEAFLFAENHPRWTRDERGGPGAGLALFENGVAAMRDF